jgi:hypothetical protein
MTTLPALATITDLGERAGEDIAADDLSAQAVLAMASAVVRAYVRNDYSVDPVPDGARVVALEVAFRVWRNPEGLIGDSIDDTSRRFVDRSGEGFYLTAAEKLVLDPLRTGRTGGLWNLGVTKNDTLADTVYVPTAPEPAGYPFPWYAADDPMIQ